MDAFMEADTFFVTAIARVTNRYPATRRQHRRIAALSSCRKFLALYSRGGTGTSLRGDLHHRTLWQNDQHRSAGDVHSVRESDDHRRKSDGFVIQFRRFAVSDDVRNGREEVVRVRRAARNIDNGFAR